MKIILMIKAFYLFFYDLTKFEEKNDIILIQKFSDPTLKEKNLKKSYSIQNLSQKNITFMLYDRVCIKVINP